MAKLMVDVDFYLKLSGDVWEPEKLENLPDLNFKINSTNLLPDAFQPGVFWLFSNRLIKLLRDSGVLFESFPVTLIGKMATITDYQLFHLLHIIPIVDLENSVMTGRNHIDRIELLEMDETPENSMIRDSYLGSKVFVREDLIQKMEQEGITGFNWNEPSEYNFHLSLPWMP